MEKTRLGISVGLLGAVLYVIGIFNMTALLLLTGYVLLFETNTWVKKTAVKAVLVVFSFAVITIIISFLVSASDALFGAMSSVIRRFSDPYSYDIARIEIPSMIGSFLTGIVTIFEKVLLILLGFKALKEKTIKIGFLDNFVSKHMD